MEKYDEIKWRKICETTLKNYINMEKRLSESKKFADFILVYYSIFLIINSLTAKYFTLYNSTLCEYFGIILSVIMLAYSLINSNANYAQRITNVTTAINSLKTLKREDIIKTDLALFRTKYDDIVDNVEFRSDIDFFRTVKSLCKDNNIKWYEKITICGTTNDEIETTKQLKNYLSELSPYILQIKLILLFCLKVFFIIFPVIIMIVCFIF